MGSAAGNKAFVSGKRLALLSRLRVARERAITNGIRVLAPSGAGITITDRGATLPVETPLGFPLTSGSNNMIVPNNVFRSNGGRIIPANNTARFNSAVIDATTASTLGVGRITGTWRVSVMFNARYVAFRLQATVAPYRFLLDDRYVSVANTVLATTSGTPHQYLLLDFGTRRYGKLTLEGMQVGGLQGAYTEATGMLWPIDTADQPRGSFLGDSYVAGSNAGNYADGVAPVMFDWLGARGLCTGSGGTGWASGNPTRYRFDERIANGDLLLDGTPDFVCLMASVNDANKVPATIQANTLAGLQSARAQLPGAPIVVFGCMPAPQGPFTGSPSLLTSEQAVQAAVASFADPLCRFVPVLTDPVGPWVAGTGAIGAETGSGNADWMFLADKTHPGVDGSAYIGRRYAASAYDSLVRMLSR